MDSDYTATRLDNSLSTLRKNVYEMRFNNEVQFQQLMDDIKAVKEVLEEL